MKKTLAILLLVGTTFLTGCGSDREDFVITNINNQVVSAPICANDAYATNQNVQLVVNAATGVLANDTPNGATLTFPTASTQGGTITGNQNGSFTYTPANNFNGTDTFTYTLGNSGGVVTCTVTITVTAVNGFFVDSVNGDDGTGSFTGGLPFASVQAAITAAGTNQDIVVRPGNYTGAVTLLNGQRLLGNGSGLAINPQGAVRPVFTGPINMADGNTIDFVRVAGTNGNAIDAQDRSNGTVTNCEVANTTNLGGGINAISSTGTWTVSNNALSSLAGFGIRFTTDSATNVDNLEAFVNDNSVDAGNFGAIGFTAFNNSQLKTRVLSNTMTNTVLPGGTFDVITADTAFFCADIENNTNDDTYQFRNNDPTATLQVEELGNLITVNNNSGVVSIGGGSDPVTDVMNNTCVFTP